tara:strand:- start:1120 stop:1929 length:810 start_codon:yes stop_codon:yes gene_type:complete
MKILKNKILTHVPPLKQSVDDLSDLPYIPAKPLTVKSPAIYICGFSSSGKTTLWNQLLLSHPTKKKPHIPKFYYRFFDRCYYISPSKDTAPLHKLKLKEERVHLKFTNELIDSIIDNEKEGENLNNLIIIDDSIKSIKNNSKMHSLLLNRRHLTQNPNEPGHAGLGIIVTSQKFNACDLILRNNFSDIFLFKTESAHEVNCIKNELMQDLSKEQQSELLKKAWSKKYSFLLIKAYEGTPDRYYVGFDKVVFDDDKKENINEEILETESN